MNKSQLQKSAILYAKEQIAECAPDMLDDVVKGISIDYLNGSIALARMFIKGIESGKSQKDILKFCKKLDNEADLLYIFNVS